MSRVLVVVLCTCMLACVVALPETQRRRQLGGKWSHTEVHVPSRAADTTKPIFSATQPVSIYYDAGLVYHPNQHTASAVASAFFEPSVVQTVQANAAPTMKPWSPPGATGSAITMETSTARHIEASDPGINNTHVGVVDTAVVVANATARTCTIYGLASSTGDSPSWTYSITGCLQYVGLDTTLSFSDDGTRVAFAAVVAGAGPGNSAGIELHVVDGSSGQLRCLWNPKLNASVVGGPRAVSTMYSGARVALVLGADFYVVNTTTMHGALAGPAPISMGFGVANAHMCPMGVFLSFGFVNTASIYMWNPAANAFLFKWNTTGPGNATHPWILESSVMSVNGEDMNPAGCVVALGWMRGDGMQAAVSVTSMLTQKQFLAWKSPVSPAGQNPPSVAMDLNYLAVGTWGSEDAGVVPTVLLFNFVSATANVPVFQYTTPGSVFGIDVVVDPYKYPPAAQGENNNSAGTDRVWVAAAGKHVHANVRGDGGDFFVFDVVV